MPHWAQLDEANVVQQVLRTENHDIPEDKAPAWLEATYGGAWARTYYDTPGAVYAGLGWTYYPELDNFAAPQPFPSWTLDTTTMTWEPPTPMPEEGRWVWDEDSQTWQALNYPTQEPTR